MPVIASFTDMYHRLATWDHGSYEVLAMIGLDAWKTKLVAVKSELQDLPDRARVAARVGHQSGLMWELSLRGMGAVARALKAPNPSQIYRVAAANVPDKKAIIWRDQTYTFGELDERIDRLAKGLQRRGVGRKKSVLLMMKNRPEFVLMQGATGRIGAAGVSISWRSTAAELVYLAKNSGAVAIVFESELFPVVEEAVREVPALAKNLLVLGTSGHDVPRGCVPFESLLESGRDFTFDPKAQDDAAVVIYTSGTTGKPKGAVRKFPRDMLPAALRFIAETPMRVDDIHLTACPLYHSTAFGFLTLTHILGATAVMMDEFRPEPFLELVLRYGVTTTAVVPTMLHRILALPPETLARYRTSSLRTIFTGGAPLPGPLGQEVMDHFGDVLYNFYGATETGLVTLASPRDLREAPATIGPAVPGNDIRLLDDAGKLVPKGSVGELWVKNKLLVEGYHEDAAATKDSLRDGYFSVGDLARCDAKGRYFIEGRKRDMIISAGVNVYPAEVEGVIEEHPDVAEVAVVGLSDAEWGERVTAFVVMRPGIARDSEALKAWTRERLAGPKRPREYVFMDVLPRNPTGKVLKRELRVAPVAKA
jgi:fatty-acyl-CoA synthase